MSHNTGVVWDVAPAFAVGPSSGTGQTGPTTWSHEFSYQSAPSGTKLLMLHFRNAVLPDGNVLEVDLGYGTDRFDATDGSEFWTRPINPYTLLNDRVQIRYLANGSPTGGAEIDMYGRGERLVGDPGPPTLSNCDPFLAGATYTEPVYDDTWFCNNPPHWDNIACVSGGDVRAQVAPSVGMIVTVDRPGISTCTVTLVDDELVVTAGHCLFSHHGNLPEELAASSSVTFDYLSTCNGSKPTAATFHKVRRIVRIRFIQDPGGLAPDDWAFVQISPAPGGLGVPPLPMRSDLPTVGEQVFGIHHPNGAVKKVSPRNVEGLATVTGSSSNAIIVPIDISGGSSGSPLFDAAGRLVGVLTGDGGCPQDYCPSARFLDEVEAGAEAAVTTRDVMIVFDRSGSMSLDAGGGRTKIEEARDAASLFVQLVRVGTGNGVGLVSFSTTASNPVDFGLAPLTTQTKEQLIGSEPFSGGEVGMLSTGGNTTIGGGLEAARQEFPAPGTNPRALLLLTDGLQNTPPMVEMVRPALAGIELHAIGFGTEASLDGVLLSALAQDLGGLYTRAGTGLSLKKFFALAFGNIFEAGLLMDPQQVIKRGSRRPARDIPFPVCDEETITVVLGWDNEDVRLDFEVVTPDETIVDTSAPGVEGAAGRTWRFLRVPLPYEGERSGVWRARVRRAKGGTLDQVRFFVNVIPDGGPRLTPRRAHRRLYTGDRLNPIVMLGYPNIGFPPQAKVTVAIGRPAGSAGDYLTRHRQLEPPADTDGDTVPARQATLQAAPTSAGFLRQTTDSFELYDDTLHEDGTPRRDGIFGNPLDDVLTVEGNYELHFRARYSTGVCKGMREALQSLYVEIGIDAKRSRLTARMLRKLSKGAPGMRLTLVPRDRYGNHLGPGRLDAFSVTGSEGTNLRGAVRDRGDGSYELRADWDARSKLPPGVVITQHGREPVVIHVTRKPGLRKPGT
jgi:hypothetical protein